MTTRPIALLFLAAALAAQDPEPPRVMHVYDLGALSAGMRSWFFDTVDVTEREFSLLGISHQVEGQREGDSVDEQDPGRAEMAAEIVRACVGPIEGFEVEPIAEGHQLLVTGTEADHKTVVRVVEQLRAAGDPPVELDVRHLTILDRSLDDAARAALLAPGKLSAEQLAALARFDSRSGRQGGVLEVAVGRWGVFRAVRELRYVPDFNVEIAQGAAIADPVPAISADGLKAAVRPFLLRDGRLLLRVVASMGDREGEPRRVALGAQEATDLLRLRNTDFGEVEQIDYRGGAVSTEAIVAPGEMATIVLATDARGELRWDVLALTVKAAPKPIVADTFVVAPVGALVTEDAPRRVVWNGTTGELALAPLETGPRLALESVLHRIGFPADAEGEFKTGDEHLHGGSLLLRGRAASLRAANEGILALERELIRPAQIEIRFVAERPGGAARAVGLLAAPLTAGRVAALAAYLRMDTIGDYEVEVAQEARIADPVHQVVTAGVFGNALVYVNADGTYRLHLDLTVAGATEAIRTIASGVGGVPILQSVALAKRVAPLRLDVAAGRPRSVDLGQDPFSRAEEGRLSAVVTVHPQ